MEAAQHVKETTATDLGWLLDAEDDAAVTLIAGETRLLAHRAVLADRSPVFNAMFRHGMMEATSGSVVIPDVEGPVLRHFLGYLYNLQVPQLPDVAPQLLPVADKYGVSALKEACEQQVLAHLSVETAAAAAVLAIRHSCGSLREAAVHFIRAHTHQVMATKGYADAVRTQPEDVVELSQLLAITSDSPPAASGTCLPPSASSQAAASASAPASAPASASASASASTSASTSASPPVDDAVSRLCAPPPAANGTCPPPSAGSQAPASASASASASTSASTSASPPVDDAVSRLWSLSPEEKGRRLMEAAKQGAVGELEALLAAGADVGARDSWWRWNRTALHWAAREGHEEAARRLLAAGAAVDARDSWQETPLHDVARQGHVSVARLLLDSGADHSARRSGGWTPLHVAAANGHTVVATLMAAGADKEAREDWRRTPLDLARQNSQQQVVQLLEGR